MGGTAGAGLSGGAGFDLLFEQIESMVCTLDGEGRFTSVNPAGERLTGYTAAELAGTFAYELIAPEVRGRAREQFLARLDGTAPARPDESILVTRDGSRVPIRVTSTTFSRTGRVTGVLGLVTDLSERNHALEEVEHGARLLAEAERLAHLGSWHRDLRTGESTWSDELYRIFGFDPGQGSVPRETLRARIHPEDEERVSRVVAEIEANGGEFGIEYRFVLPDGQIRWLHSMGHAILEGSRVVGSRGSVQDITDRKRTEAERDRLRDQLQHTQRLEAIGRLAGGVAHDFNNMLTAIRGYGELLLGRLDPGSPAHQEATQILRAAEQASTLPRQLLAFSRKQPLAPTLVDLNDLVGAAGNLLRRLLGESIELVADVASGPAPAFVDPGQIEQILLNLALNARDAMPEGGTLRIATGSVELDPETAAEHGAEAGPYVVVTVSDSGEGMDEETRAHAFEPFFTTKSHGEGTGLGLASVYGVVSQSGGFIRLDSTAGSGTTFALHFPAAAPAPNEAEGSPGEADVAPAVLLVEDEELVRELAARILEAAGYRVWAAASGAEALELHARLPAPVDVVLTDLVMPGLDGRELGRRLRTAHPGMPLVFMSGYADEAAPVDSEWGADAAFLQKPFAARALIGAVEQAVRRVAVAGPEPEHEEEPQPDGVAITCVIADDHPPVLDSVSRFLEQQGIQVVARVANGGDAIREIEARRPAIALLDVVMQPLSGIEVARRVGVSTPETGVVLYTGHGDRALLGEALDAHVRGFVLKEAPLADLVRALTIVREGGTYVDPGLSTTIASPGAVATLSPLTPREQEILALLADGMTNEKVAASLGISAETVQSHVGNAMGKLEADTRTQAVAKALRQSLIA